MVIHNSPPKKAAQQRGLRIDLALKIARTTKAAFCQKHHISINTLHAWRNGRKPLTLKGAEKIAKALEEEGVACSTEWLMEGKGLPPRTQEEVRKGTLPALGALTQPLEVKASDDYKVLKEIERFRELHHNAEVLLVTGDSMEPLLHAGDYVGGVKAKGRDYASVLNRICIVKLTNGTALIRHFSAGSAPGKYNLSCTNPLTTEGMPTLLNVTVESVAPIIWIRYQTTHSESGNL